MENRKSIESEHFDRIASEVDLTKVYHVVEKKIKGSSFINPALNGPYVFIEQWLQKNCKDKVVLDYACGTGTYTVYPIECGAQRVCGVDISPKSIDVARKRVELASVADKVVFEIGDCEYLQYPSESFDVVFSFGNLSYLDLDKAFAEISRVLRPGGQFLVVDTLGYNPLLNFKRWLNFRRGKRSEFMLRHIIKMNDAKLAMNYFEKMDEIKFFDLATLLVAPFSGEHNNSFVKSLVYLLKMIDSVLLKVPFIKYLAFKVTFILSGPKKV